ncbi:MAG: IS1595 family transposase [Brevundimonas sp.]|uniref:IS1595 family transposase n=1 Tax=Brevundimonas sp. TaxID=1871086 RepID=UPI00391D75AD
MTPTQVASLSEEEARAYFVRVRFARWGGVPTCERCKCSAVYTFKTRQLYKCKNCERQFSATSGTPWAYRKLSFKKLMLLIATFSHGAYGRSALDLCEDLRVQYKTVLVWLHKIRNEIAERAKAVILGGEVEIDGSYYGGKIRPKNQWKERKDHRRIHYRLNSLKLVVVAARERGGGPIRTWIARSEGDARPFIRDALEKGTVLFSDQLGVWSWLRSHHQLFTINHNQAFYTPEACTNAVESYFGSLRMAENIHVHISGQYLDLYAAAAAWRLSRKGKAKWWGFADLMSAMSRQGRSNLSGYFQGRKRSLSLCQMDGSTLAWRPPSKAARAAMKQVAEVGGVDQLGAARALSRNRSGQRDFSFVPADEFLRNPSAVPNGSGVYALFGTFGEVLLTNLGFKAEEHPPLWRRDGATHFYTGESYTVRSRLLEHLVGTIRTSNLRHTLFSISHALGPVGGLPLVTRDAAVDEAALSEWLRENVTVGFKTCGYVKDVENAVLRTAASPLNVMRPMPSEFASALRALKRRFSDEVAANWPKTLSTHSPRRR